MKTNSKPLISICTYEERQLEIKRNAPQVPIKKPVDPPLNGIKKDIARLNNELPPRKSKPPPPPPVKKLEKQVSLPVNVIEREPWTPTPDYDSPDHTLIRQNVEKPKGTIGRIAMHEMAKANGDIAEMESIESFKLNNPESPVPIPPPMYFSSQKSGPPTMKKIQRPISVIVSSYGNKKEPGKFNFIESNGQMEQNKNNVNKSSDDMSMRLKNELEKTLSRSNLRRRSDSVDDLLKSENRPTGNIMHLNGELEKSINDKNVNDGTRINQKTVLKKYETSTLNGILKNSAAKMNGGLTNIKKQNITFGDITK